MTTTTATTLEQHLAAQHASGAISATMKTSKNFFMFFYICKK